MAVKVGWKRVVVLFLFLVSLCVLYWVNLLSVKNAVLAFAITLFFLLITTDGFFEKCYVICKTLPRDLGALRIFVIFRRGVRHFLRNNHSVPSKFREVVRRFPNKVCFIAEDRKLTFIQVDELSNRVANVFVGRGLVKGEVVALFMDSVPEHVVVWLGLAKVGVVTALINNNLRLHALAHSITSANAKALVFGANLRDAVIEILPQLPENFPCYVMGENVDGVDHPFALSLDEVMTTVTSQPPPPVKLTPLDPLVYIYTSGTTGLPKAAIITNSRYFFVSCALNSMLTPDDVYYEPLPVYHTAGGVMGVGQAVCYGLTVVIKRKFSASQFWDDCIKHKCTVTQYLGETCRYLLARPPGPQDRKHSIRLMIGSGLRPQIWEQFVNRFGTRIIELYGSSEGNANIVNLVGKVGAVGYIPILFSNLLPCALIRVNEKTGQPLRDIKGICIQCLRGEAGEFVGKISNCNPERRFDGYVNKDATAKKIYNDVFKKGDSAFASGDVLVMDRFGYLYFKDRTGDTFRWKGENVSTAEVEAVISNLTNLRDCVVYGVEVPNCEGRAGMVAILDPTESVDLDALYTSLVKELPSYARPLFIRLTHSLPLTGTFKLKKVELQSEGFDPKKCGQHKLYYLNGAKYSPLTQQVHEDILSANIRY